MQLKRLINSVLERLTGYHLTKGERLKNEATPLGLFFKMLKHQNFQPQRIYDIGANHGRWTRLAAEFFPKASYTLVEPQDHLKTDIQDLIKAGIDIEWVNAGAGNECGIQWFTITASDDSCSFLSRPPSNGAKLNQVKMDVITLNEIATKHSGQKPDLVKIDAEGWDLKVLEGASELIGVTDIFLMEAAICAEDVENNALSVIQKFDHLGYRLIDITDLNRSPKNQALWLVELVFLRRGSSLLNGTSYN